MLLFWIPICIFEICFVSAISDEHQKKDTTPRTEKEVYKVRISDVNCLLAGGIDPQKTYAEHGTRRTYNTWTYFMGKVSTEVMIIRRHFAESASNLRFAPEVESMAAAIAGIQGGRGCILGKVTACLTIAITKFREHGRHQRELNFAQLFQGLNLDDCVDLLAAPPDFKSIITSGWPIFALYSLLQIRTDYHSCNSEEMYVPSFRWSDIISAARNFTEHLPPRSLHECNREKAASKACAEGWRDFNRGNVEKLNQAITLSGHALAAAKSSVSYEGVKITTRIHNCGFGHAMATALYTLNIVLGGVDIRNILMSGFITMENSWKHLDQILHSPWPMLSIFSTIQRSCQYDLYSFCIPENMDSKNCEHYVNAIKRIQQKHVVMTFLSLQVFDLNEKDKNTLMGNFFRNLQYLGVGEVIVIVESLNDFEKCKSLMEYFNIGQCVIPNSIDAPLLLTKYFLIDLALQFGKEVLWIEGPSVIVLQNAVAACQHGPDGDLLVGEYLFSNRPRHKVFYARPKARPIIKQMANWLGSFPFSHEQRGWNYLVNSARGLPKIESMSYLEVTDDVLQVKIGILDSTTEFVDFEGYIGTKDRIVVFEARTVDVEDALRTKLFYALESKKLWEKLDIDPIRRKINPKYKTMIKTPPQHFVHISYAEGCCKTEQNQGSRAALKFGCDESRKLDGRLLDEDFKQKNRNLLHFDRRPHMAFKSPTNALGYYVWKPYVILKTMLDPKLPWNTTVVVYTDAGLFFKVPIRQMITDGLKDKDAVAIMTPMYEQSWSKRDALFLLKADVPSIYEEHQLDSGFVALRKTRKSIEFLGLWLAACETRRIISEEPSEVDLDEYPGFMNNNDDQTAFSILFKQFGFTQIPEDDNYKILDKSRNLAKWQYATDQRALNLDFHSEGYNREADRKATDAER